MNGSLWRQIDPSVRARFPEARVHPMHPGLEAMAVEIF